METDEKIRMVIQESVFLELSLRRVFNHPNYESKINDAIRDYIDTRIKNILMQSHQESIKRNQEYNEKNKSFFGG